MAKGKTLSGFDYEISDARLNNMELVDALAELESNPLRLVRVAELMLGDEQKKALYDFVRLEDDTVPIDAIERELMEIIKSGRETKNS